MIFDTHAHYDDEDFDLDRDELLLGMKAAGVSHIVNIGASLESTKRSLELAKKYDFIYAAVGVHPSDTTELNEETFSWLKQQCKEEKVVAVGEIGLDYYWDEPDRAIQKEWFARQIALGREEKLPLVIHSRDAAADTIDIMKSEKAEEAGGILHCFSYTKETAKIFLDMDFSFGIGGVITFKNAKKLKEAVEYIPMDRIVVETDSPYLTPVPNRGKRNDSLHLPYIIEEIAHIKGLTTKEVADITWKNAETMYKMRKIED
mgnify:CR=1 FL=1